MNYNIIQLLNEQIVFYLLCVLPTSSFTTFNPLTITVKGIKFHMKYNKYFIIHSITAIWFTIQSSLLQ